MIQVETLTGPRKFDTISEATRFAAEDPGGWAITVGEGDEYVRFVRVYVIDKLTGVSQVMWVLEECTAEQWPLFEGHVPEEPPL